MRRRKGHNRRHAELLRGLQHRLDGAAGHAEGQHVKRRAWITADVGKLTIDGQVRLALARARSAAGQKVVRGNRAVQDIRFFQLPVLLAAGHKARVM